jgi:HK97 gp10 family phage protein
MSKFELNAAGIAEVLYLNPKIAAATNSVGRAVVSAAKSRVTAVENKETKQVAAKIVLKPAQIKKSDWLAGEIKRNIGKSFSGAGQFYVAVVGSNHPTTQFWEWGTSKRKATYFMRSALNDASKIDGVKKGKLPDKGTAYPVKGKKR